jgi:hypothetical protein
MAPEIKEQSWSNYIPINKLDQIGDQKCCTHTQTLYGEVNSRPSLCGRLVSKLVTPHTATTITKK